MTTETIIAVVGLLAAMAGTFFEFFGFRSYRQQRRTQKLLEKSFGSELFGPETIERSTRYYIPPKCSSVDPGQEAEMRQVVTTEEKLFDAVDKYLAKDTPHRHLLLLADSGMGKSSFVLNYYARNQRLPKRKRQRLAVVPLGIPEADKEIAKIDDQPNTVIFLDAFDEDTKAIKNHRQRLLKLMRDCYKFKRVLITCRTQFFPRDEEIPRCDGIGLSDQMKAFVKEMIPQYFAENNPVSKQVKAFVWEIIPPYLAEKKPVAKQMMPVIQEMMQHYLTAKKTLPFDLATCDLGECQLRLRSKPGSNLQEVDVRAMLAKHDFFDRSKHKDGKGIAHLYELREKIVIDHATGLMWQQSGSANAMNYADAEKYVRDLNAKRFAGYNDWRLPTLEEAMSLMEPAKKSGDLYIDPVFDRTQRWIWTADKADSAGLAWVAFFYLGYCYHSRVTSIFFVRVVR